MFGIGDVDRQQFTRAVQLGEFDDVMSAYLDAVADAFADQRGCDGDSVEALRIAGDGADTADLALFANPGDGDIDRGKVNARGFDGLSMISLNPLACMFLVLFLFTVAKKGCARLTLCWKHHRQRRSEQTTDTQRPVPPQKVSAPSSPGH